MISQNVHARVNDLMVLAITLALVIALKSSQEAIVLLVPKVIRVYYAISVNQDTL